jgi:hypothetical protein
MYLAWHELHIGSDESGSAAQHCVGREQDQQQCLIFEGLPDHLQRIRRSVLRLKTRIFTDCSVLTRGIGGVFHHAIG